MSTSAETVLSGAIHEDNRLLQAKSDIATSIYDLLDYP